MAATARPTREPPLDLAIRRQAKPPLNLTRPSRSQIVRLPVPANRVFASHTDVVLRRHPVRWRAHHRTGNTSVYIKLRAMNIGRLVGA